MRSDTCPKNNNTAALERAKVREADFKAWKAQNPHVRKKGDKKKRSFKERMNKKVQAVVTKAMENQQARAAGAAQAPAVQPGANGAPKPAPAASQGAEVAAGGEPLQAPPIPSVAVPQGPPQGPVPYFQGSYFPSNHSVAASSMASTAAPWNMAYYGPAAAYRNRGRFCPPRIHTGTLEAIRTRVKGMVPSRIRDTVDPVRFFQCV